MIIYTYNRDLTLKKIYTTLNECSKELDISPRYINATMSRNMNPRKEVWDTCKGVVITKIPIPLFNQYFNASPTRECRDMPKLSNSPVYLYENPKTLKIIKTFENPRECLATSGFKRNTIYAHLRVYKTEPPYYKHNRSFVSYNPNFVIKQHLKYEPDNDEEEAESFDGHYDSKDIELYDA